MGNELKGIDAHSAEHFGDTRDHWWNLDYLALVVKRLRLDDVHDVLDVGCGVGHWSRLLSKVMKRDIRVVGVDREPRWVEEAAKRSDERFTYRQGDALRLPFDDASFDLVTCQTVLIHLPDPRDGIAEMMRVVRPGGLVLVAEPNNMTEAVLFDSVASKQSIDTIMDLVRFQLTCERGKAAVGEGDNSIGDRVPGLFAAAGLRDVQVYTNDKATSIVAPYDTPAQRAFVEELRDHVARRLWGYGESESRRFFLAGGGAEGEFAACYAHALASRERILAAVEAGTFHGIIGGAFYLVAGRKGR